MQQQQGTRLNKYLSEQGVCSRREADRMIEAGRVLVNERTARVGDRVMPKDLVTVDGEQIGFGQEPVLLKLYKPRGIVCTESRKDPDNIVDFLKLPKRVFTIGRLDKDSEGLLLLTNQGNLVNRIMRAGNYHEKEYVVTVRERITEAFLAGMAAGVYLKELDVTTRPCPVKQIDERVFSIILTQGYNRQIRRMCRVFGFHVERLKRIRIMNIGLDDLKTGEYHPVSREEWEELQKLLADSSELPAGRQG